MSVKVFVSVHIALCLFLGPAGKASAQDGYLTCSDMWIDGQDVDLTCEISRASIASKCVTQANSTFFRKDNVPQCEVDSDGYASCQSMQGTSRPAACWCLTNETHYVFKYTFKADRYQHNGSWSCQKVCLDGGGFNNPLNITTGASCDAFVQESACDKKECMKPGVCKLDTNTNEGRCVCPRGRLEKDCAPCKALDGRDGCKKWDITLLCFSIGTPFIIAVVVVIYLFCYRQTSIVLVQNDCKGQDVAVLVEKLRSACEAIATEFGRYPKIFIALSEVTGLSSNTPCVIVISCDTIVTLKKARKKVKSKIEELKKCPNPDEPVVDYPRDAADTVGNPLRSLKPNGSSKHATNGSNVITPL